MRVGKIALLLIIICVLYDFLSPTINDLKLRYNGRCTKAVPTSNMVRIKYHKAELTYKFLINRESFEGNSLNTDTSMSGDSLCIIYLQSSPSKEGFEISCYQLGRDEWKSGFVTV